MDKQITLSLIKSPDPTLTGQRRKTRSRPNGREKDEDRGSSDDNDSDDDRRLVIAVRVHADGKRERRAVGAFVF